MSVLALLVVESSCLAAPPIAGGFLMGEPVVAVLEAVSTAVKHQSPVRCVVPGMCACSSLETWAQFAGLFLHWLLLVPCFH